MVGDRGYDSDPLDQRLREHQGVELIAPHRSNRSKPRTQDGRVLRRYARRWKVERVFAWLKNYRRILIRWERRPQLPRHGSTRLCVDPVEAFMRPVLSH